MNNLKSSHYLLLFLLSFNLFVNLFHGNNDLIEDLLKKGNFKNANDAIAAALNENPYEPSLLVYKARSLVLIGKYDESEKILHSILKANSSYVEANLALGKLYALSKRWNEAVPYLERVITVDPENYVAYVQLATIWLQRDSNVLKSKQFLLKAKEINPNDERILIELALVLFYNDEKDAAKEAFDMAEKINPDVDFKLISKVYMYYRQIPWAASILRKGVMRASLSGAPPDTLSLLLLAECEEALGFPVVAKDIYEDILSREPYNALAHTALGLLLLGLGSRNLGAMQACGTNQERALVHLRTAYQLDTSLMQASEAIDFCRKEFQEAKSWRKVVADLEGETGGGGGAASTTYTATVTTTTVSPSVLAIVAIKNVFSNIQKKVMNLAQQFCQLLESLSPVRKGNGVMTISEGMVMNLHEFICTMNSGHKERQDVSSSRRKIQEMNEMWNQRARTLPTIPVLSNPPSATVFREEYLTMNSPVVIQHAITSAHWGQQRGVEAETTTTSSTNNYTLSSLFSTANLREQFGAHLVRVSVSQSGRFDGPESGTLWGLDDDEEVLVRPPTTTMLLSDLFALSVDKKKKKEEVHKKGTLQETFYLEYLALHQYLEQFQELVPLPKFAEELLTRNISHDITSNTTTNNNDNNVNSGSSPSASANKYKNQHHHRLLDHLLTNLWIGTKPTISPLHYDDYENLLCQIRGKKEVLLFPPSDLPYLYYQGRKKGKLQYSYPPSKFHRDPSTVDDKVVVFGSSVNVDAPDAAKFPLFERSSPLRVVLEPGDMLYLPAYWHHEVQSIPDDGDDRYGGLNIAVNFWFQNVTSPIDDMLLLSMS